MAKAVKPQTIKLADLIADDLNANKGTERGAKMLASSLREYGAGRSILVDKSGRIIAGNKTAEQAQAEGLQEVIVVETTGDQLVAVKRTDLDLDDPKARALALADNRVGEVSLEWDADVLAELAETVDVSGFWTEEELSDLGDALHFGDDKPNFSEEDKYNEQYGVVVLCKDEDEQKRHYERLTGEGLECRVVVT